MFGMYEEQDYYTLSDKPKFVYNERVRVDIRKFGINTDSEYLEGRVVGIGSTNIIDLWLIEFDYDFGDVYPYKVTQVPHTFIYKKES